MKKLAFLLIISATFFSCAEQQDPKNKDLNDLETRHRELVNSTIRKNELIYNYRTYLNKLQLEVDDMLARSSDVISVNQGIESGSNDKLLADLEVLAKVLEHQRFKISELSDGIESQEYDIGSLRDQSRQLNEAIAAQQERIAGLIAKLHDDQIQNELSQMRIRELQDSLLHSTDQQNQAWFAFGSFKELKEKQVAEQKGGILGLGGVKMLRTDFNNEYFSTLDIRTTSEIPIMAEKASLLSSHPEGSYRFEGVGEVKSLQILDKDEFWKLSRHLAIVVN